MKITIYLIMGGQKKTGYWFLPKYFNYKKHAVKFRNTYYPSLKVVKFTNEELK